MNNQGKGKKKKIIEKPFFPGGPAAMKEYIRKNLVYPQVALDGKIEGSVNCRYKINHLGEVVDVFIISGLEYGCDEEAIRLIKSLKFKLPKIPHRVKAFFQKTMRIHFKLKSISEKTPPVLQSPVDHHYKFVFVEEKNPVKTYNYTITI